MKIYQIDSSARKKGSTSRALAKKLLEIYPNEKEGILDKKFASLVNKKTCLQIAKKINLDTLKKKDLSDLKIGETLLLTGKILTGRDAAHKKIVDLIKNKKPLPNGLDFTNKFIYYVGPVDPINDEVVGPAGPTTATRMDKFVDEILSKCGLIGMIGKAERSLETNSVIKDIEGLSK